MATAKDIHQIGTAVGLPVAAVHLAGILYHATDTGELWRCNDDGGGWTVVANNFTPDAVSWDSVTDKPSVFPPDTHDHVWADITDAPTSLPPSEHDHAWADITDPPTSLPPSEHDHAWADITDPPSTYAPEAHVHAWDEIADKPVTGTMFFHDSASDIATYEQILEIPAGGAEEDDSVALTAAGGEVIFERYVSGSAPGWGVILIPAGLWEFHVFSYVSSTVAGTTTIKLSVYQRSQAGAETLLFTVSKVVTATTVTMYEVISSQPEFNLLATDRLVVKVSGITTAVASRTLHFVHEGTTNDSNFEFPTLSGHGETPEEILTKLLTVDGAGSGLDADLLDGNEATAFAASAHTHDLDDLGDVNAPTPSDGNVLVWDAGTARWIPGTNGTGPSSQLITFTFGASGTLTAGAKPVRIHSPAALTITGVTATVGTAPTGAGILVDVHKNGTTIFTTQGNRPTIAATTNDDLSSTPDVTSLAQNDLLTIEIDQIGSTIAGADLVVQVRCTT